MTTPFAETFWAAASAKAAPASAAWALLDIGLGLPSGVVLLTLLGACAAVVRDKINHPLALFGTFFGTSITTIMFMYLFGTKLIGDPAGQSLLGAFLAFYFQKWGGSFIKSFLPSITSQQPPDKGDKSHE